MDGPQEIHGCLVFSLINLVNARQMNTPKAKGNKVPLPEHDLSNFNPAFFKAGTKGLPVKHLGDLQEQNVENLACQPHTQE